MARKFTRKTKSTKRLIVKTKSVPYKFNITWLDFIPPIFVKLFNYIRGYISSRYVQITYIDLGISIVFLGTVLALGISYLVVPTNMAQLSETFYLYTHKVDSVKLRPSTITKANLTRNMFKQYQNGVVLGVQEQSEVKVLQQETNKKSNSDKPLINQNYKNPDNYAVDAANYYSYYWRFN